MKAEKATPRPWKVVPSPHGPKYQCVQIGDDDRYTTLELLPDDAALIVKAVNCHDDLVAALEAIIDCEDSGLGQFQMGRRISAARAAISKAKS